MTDQQPEPRPRRRTHGRRRAALGALMLCALAALGVQLLAGTRSGGDGAPKLANCNGRGAPQVSRVAPKKLGQLRTSVARVLPGRVGRLYAEGTIVGSSVWTDALPSGPPVSRTAPRPAGYEMRWWAPNGDDLVADVLVFASAGAASLFLERASARRCGRATLSAPAAHPPQARNLAWVNPDNAAEADVYLARGTRVYRVADAPAGQTRQGLAPQRLRRAMRTVDALACLLPGAHCLNESRNVPA